MRMRVRRPNRAVLIGSENSAPFAARSLTVRSMSSHIRKSSWCPPGEPSPDGWIPSSAGGSLKMSHPPWMSTLGISTASRKNALARSGSSAYTTAWVAVIMVASVAAARTVAESFSHRCPERTSKPPRSHCDGLITHRASAISADRLPEVSGSLRSARLIIAIAAAVLVAYAVMWTQVSSFDVGRSDFTAFYVGGTLIREGHTGDLYSQAVQQPLHSAL